MKKRKDDPAERPDQDNPEWTVAEIKKARPALDLVDEVFGKHASAKLRRGRGRPPKAAHKINQTIRLDPDVLAAYRRQGKGW
ncbi:MAG: BrnA antitoxin family protein, partial [Deltaproteobacteria bacterium]|nr:BrnA antitoxin family protein [Deltaproteobacteria bacterium]